MTPRPPRVCAPSFIRSSCVAPNSRSQRTCRKRSKTTASAISLVNRRTIYAQVAREVRAQVMGEVERNGVAKSQIHILAGLTRLRQAACDPRLLGLPRQFDG